MNKEPRVSSIFQFAGMAFQWIIILVTTVYLGKWIDTKWAFTKGLFIWVLPLLALVGLMIKLVRDTSKK